MSDYTEDVLNFLREQISKPKKPKKPPYRKPESVKQLENDWYAYKKALHPDNPAVLRNPFRDDTANGLTRCISTWLTLNGHFASRINTTGTYSARLGRFIRSGSTKGMADINAVVNGRSIQVEVKVGRDRPRPDQLKVKEQVEKAGGVYIFVHSFDDFLAKLKSL